MSQVKGGDRRTKLVLFLLPYYVPRISQLGGCWFISSWGRTPLQFQMNPGFWVFEVLFWVKVKLRSAEGLESVKSVVIYRDSEGK